jgi:type I protein arginine methyltransferase
MSAELTAGEQTLGQYIPLLYHYNMLQDEDRVGAFREAIAAVVQPGMHVLELGGGTGILSSLAARRGANVTCIERNPELVACARKFIRDNGLQSQITVIHADASRFVPSTPVDVVICEMLHVGLLREKQAQVITDFKHNYMAKFGAKLPVFLPEASILMAQLVEQSFDFAGFWAPVPMFQAPLLNQQRTLELSSLSPYANIDYQHEIPLQFDFREAVVINQEGCINAIRLVTQNVIAVDLHQQRAITWPNQCLVLPIDEPLPVVSGDHIQMSFCYSAGGCIDAMSAAIKVSK